MTRACRSALAVLALTGATAGSIGAPPPEVMAAAMRMGWESRAENMGIEVLRARETARPGVPCVIHFRVSAIAAFDRTVKVEIGDERIARVVDDARVLAGQTLGYAVVELVSAGQTTAKIGERVVTVAAEVSPNDAAARLRILTPAEGAAAWGTIGVGVSWWRPGVAADAAPTVRVGVGEAARTINAKWTNTPANGPMGLAHFELETDAMTNGNNRVVVAIASGAGHEIAEVLDVHVMHPPTPPSESAVVSGECEGEYDLPPLPENRREGKPNIGSDKNASGEKFWNNGGASPRFRFPVEVPEGKPGWYQVVLTAAGDAACAALPSVGITIDEADRPRSASAIAGPGWHRAAIGTPVKLEPGKRVLRMDFLNDFSARDVDRNLRLDKIEVLRVADADGGGAAVAQAGGGAMMAGGGDAMMGMVGGAGGGGGAGWPQNVASRMTPGLRLAFAKVMDGAEVAGDLEVKAAVWWPGMGEKNTAGNVPRVTLMVNGAAVGTQRSVAPKFVVPWGMLKAGENQLQLVGSAPGRDEVKTPVQRVMRPGIGGGATVAAGATAVQRFTVYEPGWDEGARKLVTGEQNPPEKLCFGMMAADPVVLKLPEELEGEFELDVEAKGQAFDGVPILEASLITGDATTKLGAVSVPTYWESHTLRVDAKSKDAASVKLARGAKSLRLDFVNDKSEPAGADGKGGGDRNVFVQGIALRPKVKAGETEPAVSVLYPAAGAEVRAGGADAVLVRVSGSGTPASAEVWIDGAPAGLALDLRKKLGPYLLPVSLRGVSTGEHRVSVKVTDGAGKSAESEARVVKALDASASAMTAYERALVVLDRFGFGPDERELGSILAMGHEAYLRERLAESAAEAGVATAVELAEIRYPDSRSGGDVPRRALLEAVATTNPVRSRFVLWAENHFSTWIRKTEARRKADEHARFAKLGVAPFGELLLASATSPAMLVYLDQAQSFARKLNENYAREIMELHTLGVHGGYTQEDVTTLARLLTGWTLAREAVGAEADSIGFDMSPDDYGTADTYRYDPVLGEPQKRRFLGREFGACGPEERYDRTLTAIDMLAGHPKTAEFIARKIAEHYLIFPAPDDVVQELASTFTRTGGDMREVLLTLSRDPKFWAQAPGKRTSHPPEFAFRLSRCARSSDANVINEYLNLSGHGMFDRSTPDGYQENDDEVMDSNAMLQRWKFAKRLEQPLIELLPPEMRTGEKPFADEDAQKMVDLIAMRLTGRVLGEESNAAALELFGKAEGKRDERVRVLATFVASTPEVQVK